MKDIVNLIVLQSTVMLWRVMDDDRCDQSHFRMHVRKELEMVEILPLLLVVF